MRRQRVPQRDRTQAQHQRQADIEAKRGPVAPARSRSSVCKLNDEKVVNPPQKPTITNSRQGSGQGYRPCARVSVPKNPITNDPSTLTISVPQGKCFPKGSAASEIKYRAIVPKAPPAATIAYK